MPKMDPSLGPCKHLGCLQGGKRGQAYVKKETSTDDNGLIVLNKVSLQSFFVCYCFCVPCNKYQA